MKPLPSFCNMINRMVDRICARPQLGRCHFGTFDCGQSATVSHIATRIAFCAFHFWILAQSDAMWTPEWKAANTLYKSPVMPQLQSKEPSPMKYSALNPADHAASLIDTCHGDAHEALALAHTNLEFAHYEEDRDHWDRVAIALQQHITRSKTPLSLLSRLADGFSDL